MERTIERLLQQAYLFDDPRAYQAGVLDAVAALEELRAGDAESDAAEAVRRLDLSVSA